MSRQRDYDYDYWRDLHCKASLIASVFGLMNLHRDAANHMFPGSWSGLGSIALHLCDELDALKDEAERSGSYGP